MYWVPPPTGIGQVFVSGVRRSNVLRLTDLPDIHRVVNGVPGAISFLVPFLALAPFLDSGVIHAMGLNVS